MGLASDFKVSGGSLKTGGFLPQASLPSLAGFPDFCLSTNMLLGIVFSVVDNVSTRAKMLWGPKVEFSPPRLRKRRRGS